MTNSILDDILEVAQEKVPISTEEGPQPKEETKIPDDAWGDTSDINPIPEDKIVPKQPTEPTIPKNIENKDEMFKKFLAEIDTSKMELSDKEKATINVELDRIRNSYLGTVKKCDGECCKQIEICPFTPINKYPIGQNCPVEICVAKNSAQEYFRYLAEELQTSDFNIVEINTVYSLVHLDVEEFRARNFINESGLVVNSPVFAIRKTGEVIYGSIENPIYGIMEKLSRKRHRLLQRLLLTPESKAKYKVISGKDRSEATKDIISRLEEKMEKIRIAERSPNATDPSKQ